nr:hypothetical protein [Tanacetum cinerariifolium]
MVAVAKTTGVIGMILMFLVATSVGEVHPDIPFCVREMQIHNSSPVARKASASSAALPPPPSSMELKLSPPKTTTIHPTWFSFRRNNTRDSPLHTRPNNERVLLLVSW